VSWISTSGWQCSGSCACHRVADQVQMALEADRFCARCHKSLPAGSTRRRRFCSERCRVAASRRRRAGAPESTPSQRGKLLKAARENHHRDSSVGRSGGIGNPGPESARRHEASPAFGTRSVEPPIGQPRCGFSRSPDLTSFGGPRAGPGESRRNAPCPPWAANLAVPPLANEQDGRDVAPRGKPETGAVGGGTRTAPAPRRKSAAPVTA
jgi:hypothetical protein